MVGQSGLLVGGQGEVGQVGEGTLRGPGPGQVSPDLMFSITQHKIN